VRQLPEDVVCLARHIEAGVLGDDSTDVKHAIMLDHFVEQTFVGQDALDHDETDVAVGMGGISHISMSLSLPEISHEVLPKDGSRCSERDLGKTLKMKA
jgi:hypothetical protein